MLDRNKKSTGDKNTIYITVGPAALRGLLKQEPEGHTVSMFTSRQAYESIKSDDLKKTHLNSITAIYAEPSPAEQMHLSALLYKKKVGIAVLLSEKTTYLLPILQKAALKENLELEVNYVYAGDSLNRALSSIERAQVLLAIPDDTIFNGGNIRNILMTMYRQNKSVVGFSSALVKAGALASTYSEIDDVIEQLDEILIHYDNTGRLQEPQYPKYFSSMINEDVARSLNRVVDDSARKFSRKVLVGHK